MAKVKNFWSIDKKVSKFISEAAKQLPQLLKTEIVDNSILKGKSPVRGDIPRFQKYSESYIEKIKAGASKRISPVNLKVTGDLLKSLKFSKRGTALRVEFTDEKAVYHDYGTDKLPQRKILPSRTGEEFTILIQRKIKKLLDQIFKSVRNN